MNSNFWGLNKPPAGCQINWGHPLAKGLVRLYTFSEGHGILCADLCQRSGVVGSGGQVISATSDPWVATERGVGVKFDGTASYVDAGPSNVTTMISGGKGYQFSMECLVRWGPSNIQAAMVMGEGNTAAASIRSDCGIVTHNGTPANLVFIACSSLNSTVFECGNTLIPTSNAIYHIVATYDTNGNATLYLNNTVNGTLTNSAASTSTPNRLSFGAVKDSTVARFWNGTMIKASLYNRALLPVEVAQLYAQPFSMVAPPVWRRYFIPQDAAPFPPWPPSPMQSLLAQ